MKLILSETSQIEFQVLSKTFESWGWKVLEKKTVSAIDSTLKAISGIHLVIVGSGIDVNRLVRKIRKNEGYTYLIYLAEDESKIEFEDQERPDRILFKPIDVHQLRVDLFSISRIIEFTRGLLAESPAQNSGSYRQIINLITIGKTFGTHLDEVKKQFSLLFKQLRSLEFNQSHYEVSQWRTLESESDKLGCERLSDWISWILLLKENAGLTRCFSQPMFHYQLSEVRSAIEKSYRCLLEFGFLKNASGISPKNVLEGKRVLLVEDMEYNRVLLKKILQKQNCILHEATNGQHAIELWSQLGQVDLIIMDMNMPVMDGFAATKKIREIEAEKALRKTPIIALTALAMRGDKELCLEAGTDDYLPKPVEAPSLIEVCSRLLLKEGRRDAGNSRHLQDFEIKTVLLQSQNQIDLFILTSFFEELEIETQSETNINSILNGVIEESYDLMILDSATDLELAYFIKNNFRQQLIALLSRDKRVDDVIPKKETETLRFPYTREQIIELLEYFSERKRQALREAENMADVNSLSKINRKAAITDVVQKSDDQLAVWQKAFRKIGGDLVISHQFNLHGKFGFVLGDVAGHDIQSGYTASWFSGLVEGIWRHFSNPHKFLVNLNNRFAHDAEEENKRYVCALVILWDPLREELHYANAGIPGGILIKKNTGKSELINWKGVPIGLFPDMDMYDSGVVDFQAGDKLIMATDGVLEAIPREIISGLSESNLSDSAQQTLDTLVDFVSRSIEIVDDLTLAVFKAKTPLHPIVGYRQTIKSDFKAVDQAVSRMTEFINTNAANTFDWPLVSVAIREALINAVEHGNRNIVDLPVDIDVELIDKKVVVTISDCGSGFDLSIEKRRLEREGDLRIHGRGIEMMETIGKSVTYLGGGIRMEFE